MKIVGFNGSLPDRPGILTWSDACREPSEKEMLAYFRESHDANGCVVSPLNGSIVRKEEMNRYKKDSLYTPFPTPVDLPFPQSSSPISVVMRKPIDDLILNDSLVSKYCGIKKGWDSVGRSCDHAIFFQDFGYFSAWSSKIVETAHESFVTSGDWRGNSLKPYFTLVIDHPGLKAMWVANSKNPETAKKIAEVVIGRNEIREKPGGEVLVNEKIAEFRRFLQLRQTEIKNEIPSA